MSESMHPGYEHAREMVERMTRDELLAYIDSLWGRDALDDNASDEDIREEALSQCASEFTIHRPVR